MMSGEVLELWSGDELEYCDTVRPGDYVYIPANVPHVAVKSRDHTRRLHGIPQESTAQESVVMRPEMDAQVP